MHACAPARVLQGIVLQQLSRMAIMLQSRLWRRSLTILSVSTFLSSILSPLPALADEPLSPYIYEVLEYCPAPGQFINTLPRWEEGEDADDMAVKCTENLGGRLDGMVSLGAYGGYITFAFDHRVENVPGAYDMKILGNAFYANANPNPDAPREGGSCEQGIVMVSVDVNDNGLPDDPWYELAGSEYNSPATIHNYSITYYRPDENKVRTPQEGYVYINDTTYIRWTDSEGKDSYLARNTFHNQSYWPQWADGDELTFTGTRLADNWVDESGNGSYYVLYSYPWGYVDNHPNEDERSNFKIDWAVDADGNHVDLPGADFIRVYTGVNQYCGWLGETSTEVCGAIDLHVQSAGVLSEAVGKVEFSAMMLGDQLVVSGAPEGARILLYTPAGSLAASYESEGEITRVTPALQQGVYIVACGQNNSKILIR